MMICIYYYYLHTYGNASAVTRLQITVMKARLHLEGETFELSSVDNTDYM